MAIATFLDLGVVALIGTSTGVLTPLTFFAAVQNMQARFLFKRPSWLRLGPRAKAASSR